MREDFEPLTGRAAVFAQLPIQAVLVRPKPRNTMFVLIPYFNISSYSPCCDNLIRSENTVSALVNNEVPRLISASRS